MASSCGSPVIAQARHLKYATHETANTTDQYVAYHNPLPFFESILQSGDCSNPAHFANLFDSGHGLYHDLQHESTTPAFTEIIPNDCSDGHDAVCKGNNLSGGFSNPTTANAPVNYTGGLYSTDLFLEHIIPEIEASPAFRDGGLIDLTFDEAYPPFTFNNSFANSTLIPPTAAGIIQNTDEAGETLWNEGFVTAAERELGLVCFEYGFQVNMLTTRDTLAADTEKLNLLAGRWSLDPAAIPQSAWRTQGIVGEVPQGRLF